MYDNQTLAQIYENNKFSKSAIKKKSADFNDSDYLCMAFSNV